MVYASMFTFRYLVTHLINKWSMEAENMSFLMFAVIICEVSTALQSIANINIIIIIVLIAIFSCKKWKFVLICELKENFWCRCLSNNSRSSVWNKVQLKMFGEFVGPNSRSCICVMQRSKDWSGDQSKDQILLDLFRWYCLQLCRLKKQQQQISI